MADIKAGRVSQVIGAVVDVTFDDHLPAIAKRAVAAAARSTCLTGASDSPPCGGG